MSATLKKITRIDRQLSLWLAASFAVCLSFVVLPASGQISVIAHDSVPVDSLNKKELLQLFSGDRDYWDDDLPVVIMDLSVNGAIRDSFYSFLGKTSSRMRSIWLKRKLTGEGDLPLSIDSEEELLLKVASTQGAIGFVSADIAKNTAEIKILISDIPFVQE